MAEKIVKNKTTKSNKPKTTVSKAKKSSVKSTTRAETVKSKPQSISVSSTKKPFRIRRSYVITLAGLIIVMSAVFFARNYLIAAVVNGQPISRLTVIQDLERQGGKQTLDTLITKSLIKQEAKNKNITVSQADINSELKRLEAQYEKQGQKLDQVLSLNGMKKEQLVELIELQKTIEKMVGKQTVTDTEVKDYLERNRASLPQDQDDQTLEKNIRENLIQQKTKEKEQSFLEQLRKNAKIDYYVQY